jgi:hypothetical protein
MTEGSAPAAATNVQAASTLVGALASALEAALPVAVTAVSTAAAVLSSEASASARPAALSGVDASPAVRDRAAEGSLAGDFGEKTPTDVSDAGGTSGTGYVDRGSEADAREPVRLYAEWSDQGVSVWLGADANQESQVSSLVNQVQQWLAGQGERLRAVVCNGRVVRSDTARNTAAGPSGASETIGRPDSLPESSRSIASNRY